MNRAIALCAPAKVNLFLGVGERLASGYHNLESVFHSLELHDVVTLEPASELEVVCHPDVGVPATDNLAFRAARALEHTAGREARVRITIEKHIPHGAGLAGGSGDAAAAIAGIAQVWGIDPRGPECMEAAASVGADVPFALVGGAALMTGRGDVCERSLPALATPVVLVKPDAGVPTARAYRLFDEHPQPAGDPQHVIAALERADAAALGAALENNLAPAACAIVPQIARIGAWLSAQPGVLGTLVAGSGSATFALVADAGAASDIAARAAARGWWSCATALAPRGVAPVESQVPGDATEGSSR